MVVGSSVCEVCDRSDGTVEAWPQGARAHADCVPGYWKRDRNDAEAFNAQLHRVRYELTDEGKINAACSKCGWWSDDWPNRVGDLYRRAAEHHKGV